MVNLLSTITTLDSYWLENCLQQHEMFIIVAYWYGDHVRSLIAERFRARIPAADTRFDKFCTHSLLLLLFQKGRKWTKKRLILEKRHADLQRTTTTTAAAENDFPSCEFTRFVNCLLPNDILYNHVIKSDFFARFHGLMNTDYLDMWNGWKHSLQKDCLNMWLR